LSSTLNRSITGWPRGEALVCKTSHTGSNPVSVSIVLWQTGRCSGPLSRVTEFDSREDYRNTTHRCVVTIGMSDERVPVNTKVSYHGSETSRHGEYIIRSYTDPEILRAIKGDEIVDKYYPDEIAYILWPVDLPHKFGERYNGVLYDVRRQSFDIVEDQ
jgi:hypothetical protein